MSARDILSRVEELIDAEIADRVRNARANAIKSCAGYVRKRAANGYVWEMGPRGNRCYEGEAARVMAIVWRYSR